MGRATAAVLKRSAPENPPVHCENVAWSSNGGGHHFCVNGVLSGCGRDIHGGIVLRVYNITYTWFYCILSSLCSGMEWRWSCADFIRFCWTEGRRWSWRVRGWKQLRKHGRCRAERESWFCVEFWNLFYSWGPDGCWEMRIIWNNFFIWNWIVCMPTDQLKPNKEIEECMFSMSLYPWLLDVPHQGDLTWPLTTDLSSSKSRGFRGPSSWRAEPGSCFFPWGGIRYDGVLMKDW